MFRNLLFYSFIGLLLASVFACAPTPCDDANGVQVNLGFYLYDGVQLTDTLIDSLVVYTMNDLETPYYDGTKTKISSIALPLSMISDTSAFVFQFDSLHIDTIEFYYTQYTRLVSHECGFVNFYNITNVTTTLNLIDSVWVRKNLVEYGDEENVKIYF